MTAYQPDPDKLTAYQELGGGVGRDVASQLGEQIKRVVRKPVYDNCSRRPGLEQGDSGLDPYWNITREDISPKDRDLMANAPRGRELARQAYAQTIKNDDHKL